jgi:hypothetical protein
MIAGRSATSPSMLKIPSTITSLLLLGSSAGALERTL